MKQQKQIYSVEGPIVERYSLLVSLPVRKEMIVIRDDIKVVEEYFEKRTCQETDKELKKEFNMVRAVLRYAISHNAQLDFISYKNGRIKVPLSFMSLKELKSFKDTMAVAIELLKIKPQV